MHTVQQLKRNCNTFPAHSSAQQAKAPPPSPSDIPPSHNHPALLCFHAVCSAETKSRTVLEDADLHQVLQTTQTSSERRSHTQVDFVNGSRSCERPGGKQDCQQGATGSSEENPSVIEIVVGDDVAADNLRLLEEHRPVQAAASGWRR